MYFKTYDYITGEILSQTEKLDFGDIFQNRHCVKPLVFKIFSDTETSISNFKIYLENNGWPESEFGYYISSTFESGIESGSTKLSNHFTAVPDASSTSPHGVSIGWDTTSSYYIWLDTQITDQTGNTQANFRFFFDYS